MPREAGLTRENVTHLIVLLVLTVALAFFQTEYLGWHGEALFPRWRSAMVALGVVLQLNQLNNAM